MDEVGTVQPEGEGYRSVEQKIWDSSLGSAMKLGRDFFYGTHALLLRAPTSIRKFANKQTFASLNEKELNRRYSPSGNIINFLDGAAMIAAAAALLVEGKIAYDLVQHQYSNGNNIPLYLAIGVPIVTNIASGLFELGRREQSRREYDQLNKMR